MNSLPHDPSSSDRPNGGIVDCETFAEDLSHFVLGELQDERRPALEQHLVACAACRAERDLLVRSVELVRSEGGAAAPIVELSAPRRAELLAEAAGTAARPRSWFTIERMAVAAALVVGAGLAGTWWVQRVDTKPSAALCARPVENTFDAIGARDSFEGRIRRIDGEEYAPSDKELAAMLADPSATGPEAKQADVGLLIDGTTDPTMLRVPVESLAEELLERQTVTEEELDSAGGAGHHGHGVSAFSSRRAGGASGNATPPADPSAPGTVPEAAPEPAGATGGTTIRLPGGGGSGSGRSLGQAGGKNGGRVSRGMGTKPGAGPATKSTTGAPAEPAPADELEKQLRELGYLDESPASLDSGITLWAHPSVPQADDASGYAYPTGSGSFAYGPGTLPSLALLLADSNAPSDLMALQPQLMAAFRFDPNTPASSEDANASAQRSADLVREYLQQLAPRQGETPRDMFFRYFGDHSFVSTRVDCKSTFGMDADTASYNLVRAYLTQGNLPPKSAVRTEEFVNAFRHDLAPPSSEEAEVFAIRTELAPSPFGEQGQLLLQIGLKAREVSLESRRPVALTFVIDVSGSMEEGGRLEMVKRALRLLVNQLDERDTIGIVTFSTNGRRALDPVSATRRGQILSTLDSLRPDGSTNADAGLRLGYDMALEQLRPNAENRVILCSDGVANTGVTDVNWLVARIRECKSKYVYLNCVGVGMNNHNDALLEQLADEGDGTCAYVDRDEEAKEIFVDKLSGTLVTVARNAKVQVDFDPLSVRRFRQLGYENRALAHRDFRNDRVDAGEVGAGHEVVALYEIELQPNAVGPLATVRCRYEEPRSAEVIEQARQVFAAECATSAQKASPRFRLTMAVAEFAEILRQSIHARSGSLADVQRFAEPLVDELPGDDDVPEFVALVKQAARLPDLLPRRTELVRAVDELKRVRCWQEELRDLQRQGGSGRDAARDAANDDLMRQLEEQNRKLEEALRDALERVARGA